MNIARLVGMTALATSLYAGNRLASHADPAAAPDVTVYANNAGVMNLQTKALASQMLATAGVQVAWRSGKPTPNPACGLVVAVDFVEAGLRDSPEGVLARAYPFGGGVHRITVLVDRLQTSAGASGVDPYKLTAHVLVHEIGHVLERVNRHSDTGVMKAQWTPADYQAMSWKQLPFAEDDIVWIHLTLEDLRAQRLVARKE